MPMRDSDLLASSGSLDGITKCINNYYCGTTGRQWRVDPETLGVLDPDGVVNPRVIVRKKGRRYRFERVKC